MKRISMFAVFFMSIAAAYATDNAGLAGLETEAGMEAAGISVPAVPGHNELDAARFDGAFVSVEFVKLPGGSFVMGRDDVSAAPAHNVTLRSFEISKTPVTVEQYAECVAKGYCTEPMQPPGGGKQCNWGVPGRQKHPVNCVSWYQAQAYAGFKCARLPSEAEWEYAARSGGRNQIYPWGNNQPADELVVFNSNTTMPVCSKPKGNTAQGLCDMSGNVWEWVQDTDVAQYNFTVDGTAVSGEGYMRVIRGGSFLNDQAELLRADVSTALGPEMRHDYLGFRIAR